MRKTFNYFIALLFCFVLWLYKILKEQLFTDTRIGYYIMKKD